MAKAKVQFVCAQCGGVQPRWMGKCPDCGAWDALQQFNPEAGANQADRHNPALAGGDTPQAVPLSELDGEAPALDRLSTGIGELDRVLGGGDEHHPDQPTRDEQSDQPGADGSQASSPTPQPARAGLVPGSGVLVGGDPGIGKSTLMLQAALAVAERGQRVLYVTSEESAQQLRLRSQRLTAGDAEPGPLYVLADTNLPRVIEQARQIEPAVLVIDSIQMIYKPDVSAAPGAVSQLRGCCLDLIYFAKSAGCALLLVGHVTKQGNLAGPRILEHMVDTVLYFEGDRYHNHRIVRGIKNRFGNTLEVGLFEMSDQGLREVTDGAGLLSTEYETRSGSVICPALHGSRCLMVELQALTATGILGAVKRKVSGLDSNRLAMLIAVLEKRGGLRLADQDVFASSVGGMKVIEPAADLALALAIAGSHLEKSLEQGVCVVGELGLGGEVRHVQQLERRLFEASRLGFKRVIAPPSNVKTADHLDLATVRSLDEAIEMLA
jgi:DNA repair protein RadA/Sms